MNATKLATVKLPAGVASIGQKAFTNTTKLATLTQKAPAAGAAGREGQDASGTSTNKLTKSITKINNYAFQNTGLEQLDLTVTTLSGANTGGTINYLGNSIFQGATSLTSLTLPETLTTIPAGFVAGATSLTQLTIPATFTTTTVETVNSQELSKAVKSQVLTWVEQPWRLENLLTLMLTTVVLSKEMLAWQKSNCHLL